MQSCLLTESLLNEILLFISRYCTSGSFFPSAVFTLTSFVFQEEYNDVKKQYSNLLVSSDNLLELDFLPLLILIDHEHELCRNMSLVERSPYALENEHMTMGTCGPMSR